MELSLQSRAPFCRHFPQVLWMLQVFSVFRWNRALAIVSCTFLPSFSTSALNASGFFQFFCEIELSLQSRAPFCRHLPQVLWMLQVFFNFSVKSSSRYSLVHIFGVIFHKCSECFRFFSPPARWGLLDFMSVDFRRLPLLPPSPDLNHDHPRQVFPAGPQPRPSTPSVPCRTSTARIHAKSSLPDLNRDHPRQVFPAGPQPRPSTPSVPCRTSTARIHPK